jgi:IS1 family transposase
VIKKPEYTPVPELNMPKLFPFGAAAGSSSPIRHQNPDAGDIWLWVAVDADAKLVPSWRLGQRDLATATDFVNDLAKRVKGRVQITTDALKTYVNVIEDAFGSEVDFAQLHKVYRSPMDNETRYSPAKCIGCSTKDVSGNPDPKHVSTSFLERQNWTVRTTMRRYTRLSSGFSRKLENHAAATALNYFAYKLYQDSSYTSHVSGDGRWRDGSTLGSE